jgi:hypothetical protein
MSAPAAQLLLDVRKLERLAAAAGADDCWLGGAISRLTLLCMGVPLARVDGFLHAQQLIESGLTVKTACERSKLSRRRYYQLREVCAIPAHMVCDARGNNLEEPRMTRVAKSVNIKDAGDVRPPRDTAGKPPYTPAPAPRGSGGLSSGATAGNFDVGSLELPNSVPQDAWDKGSQE